MKIIAKRQNYSWSKKVPVLTVEKINLTHQYWSRKPIQIIIINYPKLPSNLTLVFFADKVYPCHLNRNFIHTFVQNEFII